MAKVIFLRNFATFCASKLAECLPSDASCCLKVVCFVATNTSFQIGTFLRRFFFLFFKKTGDETFEIIQSCFCPQLESNMLF